MVRKSVHKAENLEQVLIEEKPKKVRTGRKKEEVDVDEVIESEVTVTDESVSVEEEVDSSVDPTTEKKTVPRVRKPNNLQTVLDLLNEKQVARAMKMLQAYVDKHGPDTKRRVKKTDDNGVPKPLNAHKQFIKDEIKKLTDEHPEMPSKDRMRVATQRWNEKKQQQQTVSSE